MFRYILFNKTKSFIIAISIVVLAFNMPVSASEIMHNDPVDQSGNQNVITSKDIIPSPYSSIPGNDSELYSNVTPDNWAYQALKELYTRYNYLNIPASVDFKNNLPVKRYELAQILARLVDSVNKKQIELSHLELVAISSLKSEYTKEINTLTAKVEINTQKINNLEEKHNLDTDKASETLTSIKKRHYFTPEMRFRGKMGDPDASTDARVRLSSKTFITPRTYYRIRLEASTDNLINNSELNGDIVDTDLTLAYINTGDLTRWIPKKFGKVNLVGGVLSPRRIFTRGYRVDVDQRGFSDSNAAVSAFNSQINSFIRDTDNGRRLTVGGEYIKKFRKHRAFIRAGATRSTGGSINVPGVDVLSSGDESSFYVLTGDIEIPTKKNPIELKVSHSYLFGDDQGDKNTWSVGGRIATKIDNFGVIKGAIIGHGGTAPVRYLEGRGGSGICYQFAYNPTIKAFGNLFGDPDKITSNVYDYIPGKTEFGIAFSSFNNRDDESLKVLDIFASRYLSRNVWGVVRFTHLNPDTNSFRSLSNRNYVEFTTIFNF